MSIKSTLASVAKKVAPGLYWARKIRQYRENFSEVEMRLLPYLCKKEKTSIDIGAAGGVFIANLLDLSKNVIGFEPIPADAEVLKVMVESTNSNCIIERVALSDKAGEAILKMIVNDSGRSTIEESNDLSDDATEKRGIKVPIRKLDDYNYDNIGFIKIDVEGHELSVLHGARETIRKNLPTLLIEIEDRHKPNAVRDVPAFLKEFGYFSFFIADGKLKPMEEFVPSIHQDSNNIGSYLDGYKRKGVYINNFIFVPKADLNKFIKDTQTLSLS
ncbi:MAG: FkbM family methyltransferase [Ferruginibacter sp.]